MLLGVDYYPEQWPENLMDEDINRMVELGVNTVRIGEFAWHLMEKQEGNYDFSFFDKVIKKLKKKNIKVIFGTPTATMPAWLVKKHPDILSKDIDGIYRSFGGRRQYCFNSDIYKEYTKKIVARLVQHYKDEENIIAWQIDNEFGHEGSDMCYCEKCLNKFREFLKEKYKTIDNLNNTWGTVFWGQTYNDFNEIPLPLKTITVHNPALQLDYARFRSKSIEDYASLQVNLIKKYGNEEQIITTNLAGGVFDKHFHHDKVVEKMDIVSYDNYPVWGGLREPIPPFAIAAYHDFMRGLKEKNFWIVEELMGAQGHNVIGYLPRPNQAKMWSYQAMAHGCEGLLYFRWRAATFGAEEFCYGILDHDNKNGRKFYEVQSFFNEIKQHEELIKTNIKAEIAALYDYENIWSFNIQPQSSAFNYFHELLRLYEPFYRLNTHIDVIPSSRDFSKYKIILMPVMMIKDDDLIERLEAFVKSGGTLIMSFRAGIKNRNNNINFGEVLPCGYDKLAGIEIHEVESLQTNQYVAIKGEEEFKGKTASVETWRDIISPTGAKALYTYDDKFYKGKACITENNYGKGKVYYIGAGAPLEILQPIVENEVKKQNIDCVDTPLGVEAYKRVVNDKEYLFIMNHTEDTQKFKGIELEPYESKILEY